MATDDAAGPAEAPIGPSEEDRPELLIKLQARKVRHKQRNLLHRVAIVIAGVLIVIAGVVTILIGLGFLALEFDWAERWMERVILWGDRAAGRAEQTTTRQRVIAGIAAALAAAAFAYAAIRWDIPLMPVL
jgi:hypothetical protein